MANTRQTKKITGGTLIPCKNGVMGHLIYISTRQMGYQVEWDGFGDVQEIEFSELQTMRGSQRRFFEDNWILIDDAEVLKQLGVDKYYKNHINTENFDTIFTMSPEQIENELTGISEGLKCTIADRAREKVKDGSLDSLSVIKTISRMCNCDLSEDI